MPSWQNRPPLFRNTSSNRSGAGNAESNEDDCELISESGQGRRNTGTATVDYWTGRVNLERPTSHTATFANRHPTVVIPVLPH
jgi:hypothetical protein